jgi:hypothetical protein
MARKTPPPHTSLALTSTSTDPLFALAADSDFASLISPLGTLPAGPYDYAYVATNASTPGIIRIGDDLAALNGLIATGNGTDDINLLNSTGNNLIYAGNGVDKVVAGAGDDIAFGGNGNDDLSGGAGDDHLDGGNGVDVVNGNAGNDWLNGGQGADRLAGGTDEGTATINFAATAAGGASVTVLSTNAVAIADGAALTTGPAGPAGGLVEEGVFVDTATAPDTVHHVFSFTPTDVGPPGGAAAFIVAVYDADGGIVDSFDVTLTEGSKNFFSLVDNDAVDDGGTVAVFTGGAIVPGTLNLALGTALTTEAYVPVTLTPVSVEVSPGDTLLGGAARDTFVYHSGDGVDLISDYGRGDVIELHGIDPSDVTGLVEGGNITLLFGDGAGGIAPDAAIQVTGVSNISDLHLLFV